MESIQSFGEDLQISHAYCSALNCADKCLLRLHEEFHQANLAEITLQLREDVKKYQAEIGTTKKSSSAHIPSKVNEVL